MFFCRRCGCHATTRPRALLAPCKGSNPLGRFNLDRISRRLHPYTEDAIGRPRRVSVGSLRRVASTRVEFPSGAPPRHLSSAAASLASQRRRASLLDDVPVSVRARLRPPTGDDAERVTQDHVQFDACPSPAPGPHPTAPGQPGQPGEQGWVGHRVQLIEAAVRAHDRRSARSAAPAKFNWDNSQASLVSEHSQRTDRHLAGPPEPFFEAFSSPP